MRNHENWNELVEVWRDIKGLMNADTPRFRSLLARAEFLEMRVQLDNPKDSFAKIRATARAA